MILRRLREYVRQENWFAVILELVVVVVGLFLAFQLDRWYETQRIKSDQHIHLESLAEDFTENESRLTSAPETQEGTGGILCRLRTNKTDPEYARTTISHDLATIRVEQSRQCRNRPIVRRKAAI